jgi:hypothetical protein
MDLPSKMPAASTASPVTPPAASSAALPVLTAFMLVKTMPEWLSMAGDERHDLLRQYIEPLLKKYAASVRLRSYDIEFYSARVTDIWMWEATTHQAYELLVEELRDTPFWDRYFAIVEILAGVENTYSVNHERGASPV